MKRKNIALFGSTGSIGYSALQVVKKHSDRLAIYALAAHSNIEDLAPQIEEFQPQAVAVFDAQKAEVLQKKYPSLKVVSGLEGLCFIAQLEEVDFALMAMSSNQAILPLVKAIEAKKQIGLANKEVLISAGEYITTLAKKHGVQILPIDSEHSALFQCLTGEKKESVRRLILTASGGPFKNRNREELLQVTKKDALNHPTWKMGPKITIDSSTLMNKGLEVIEAFWLFDIPIEKIEVVIHPESIIHSIVEFVDGSMKAQLSKTSMQMPIHYALFYPERVESREPPFDFLKYPKLTFQKPNFEKFPCLELAFSALKKGRSAPCFLSGANEVLVERFLNDEISWHQIGEKLTRLMSLHESRDMLDLDQILAVDLEARKQAGLV